MDRAIRVVLGAGAAVFVLLLAGVGEGQLTDDPPAVSPYNRQVSEAASTEGTGEAAFIVTTIDFESGVVGITNVGSAPGDLSGWLCQRPSYAEVSAAGVEPGEMVWVAVGDDLPATSDGVAAVVDRRGELGRLTADDGEMGFYADSTFGSSDSIISYVEWGSSGHGRSGVAVAAGIWPRGGVVDATGAGSITLDSSRPADPAAWTSSG